MNKQVTLGRVPLLIYGVYLLYHCGDTYLFSTLYLYNERDLKV